MKIAMVFPDSGAATAHPKHVAALSTGLARAGHEVTMYTNRANERLAECDLTGCTVVYGPNEVNGAQPDDVILRDLGGFTQFLVEQWDRATPDLAHAHFWTAGIATQLAARSREVPTVQTFHSLAAKSRSQTDSGAQSRMRLETLLARGASWLIATSSEQKMHLGRMGATRARTSVVPCGVDVDVFTPVGPQPPAGDRHRILTVAGPTPGNGVDTVIQALRFVPGAELVVAGMPDDVDDPEVKRLGALAAALHVSDRVVLRGAVPHEQMPALLRSADVLVCVPTRDSFGLIALEAMACGVPVVASAVGGFVDTLVDDVTGRLISPDQPRDCADAILGILRDPFARSGLGAVARDRAVSRFSWDRIAEDTSRVYHQLIPPAPTVDARQRFSEAN